MLIKKINFIVLNWMLSLASQDEKIDFAVGGQAVIEGVMMRSPSAITIAVRKPNGHIKIKREKYKTVIQRLKFLNIPIVRGVINLFEMMVIGTKAINFSANESLDEAPPSEEEINKSGIRKFFEGIMFVFSLIIALAVSLSLFKALPLFLTTYLDSKFEIIHNNFALFNLVDGAIKASIFLTYIFLLSLIPSFRRIFEYHGSEHKAIFTYENKLDLTVENAKIQSRFHPRCGTSFIIIVFIISVFVYTLVPKQPDFIHNLALRITVLPLVAGISYELLKLSAKHTEKKFVKFLIAPGLAFQRLTTKEPDAPQLEVGLKSLEAALAMEN
ncbi:DUF1385 domain-containing protein [Candidatus Peregrinibacteria bacterium CG10_big_fil_rev_8_21_14_0_10_36_19]|nr:MAG: DUF1385 domain-containing protein [Candidatus Peregrinibacteria bacterium CG10_big_fil_rev_8_21_14_0_10_36_19]